MVSFLVAQVGFWAMWTIAIKVHLDPITLQITIPRHCLDRGEIELADEVLGRQRMRSSDHVCTDRLIQPCLARWRNRHLPNLAAGRRPPRHLPDLLTNCSIEQPNALV
ncbi:hypothetical protein BDP81DRAFT_103733 [Colletotrichum phormii]|uniref:Secreted protein n=1 Tax=Colletotrichum phormii TaxID=359342 RepID=A0AAI9ZKH2_9PEZI|nr:uncharacterized protein BDP81DRAFT_103733 [Colletotrichum phormii]KAK1624966.1 hypothetical protein BDP81DRAFT_103733 [Colletotrichum phormii]